MEDADIVARIGESQAKLRDALREEFNNLFKKEKEKFFSSVPNLL